MQIQFYVYIKKEWGNRIISMRKFIKIIKRTIMHYFINKDIIDVYLDKKLPTFAVSIVFSIDSWFYLICKALRCVENDLVRCKLSFLVYMIPFKMHWAMFCSLDLMKYLMKSLSQSSVDRLLYCKKCCRYSYYLAFKFFILFWTDIKMHWNALLLASVVLYHKWFSQARNYLCPISGPNYAIEVNEISLENS